MSPTDQDALDAFQTDRNLKVAAMVRALLVLRYPDPLVQERHLAYQRARIERADYVRLDHLAREEYMRHRRRA